MRRRTWPLVLACLAVAPIAAAVALLVGHDVRRAEAARPLFARDQDYVGASACRACHPDRYASWRRTYHASMTQLPDERDRARTLRRPAGDVVRRDRDAVPARREVLLPTSSGGRRRPARRGGRALRGLAPLSAVLRAHRRSDGTSIAACRCSGTSARRAGCTSTASSSSPTTTTGRRAPAVWNMNCVFCHNTGIAPGLKPVGDGGDKRFDTHVADVGIACESCHGPGRDHVALYASPLARYRTELARRRRRAAVVDPLRLGQAESAALCGQCHAQRLPGSRWRSCGRSSTRDRRSGRAACSPAT